MVTFDLAFTRCQLAEKGYVNDPQDPGGETKYGISKRAHPNIDIASLTIDQAKAIYLEEYWAPFTALGCSDEVAYQLFDFAVNSGVSTVMGIYKRLLNGKLSQLPDYLVVMLITAARMDYDSNLENWPHDGKGWTRRIAQNLRYAVVDL